MRKAVLGTSDACRRICQNPQVASKEEKYLAPPTESRTSSMRGMGYWNLTVTALSSR